MSGSDSASTTRSGRPKQAIARFLHSNRSIHTHSLGERDGDRSCAYCDMDAGYALRALEWAGFDVSQRPCQTCGGNGRNPVEQLSEFRCPDCLGTGRESGSTDGTA